MRLVEPYYPREHQPGRGGQTAPVDAPQQKASGAKSYILHRASRGHPLRGWQEKWNRMYSRIRAGVEHVFGVLKHGFGWRRVRFRGLKKNAEYAYAAVACVNIYQHRRRLLEYLEGGQTAIFPACGGMTLL